MDSDPSTATATATTGIHNRSSSLQLHGTKAWTAGSVLVSTGLRELDAILAATTAGGQPLGSCIYLESDRWSDLSDCLVRYWCAEVRTSYSVIQLSDLYMSQLYAG